MASSSEAAEDAARSSMDGALGGSEVVAMWSLQALQKIGCVTFVTSVPVDLEKLNRLFGTAVDAKSVKMILTGKLPFISHPSRVAVWQRAL